MTNVKKEELEIQLDRLDRAFPGRELLSQEDIASYLGKSKAFVWRRIPHQLGRYTKTDVANFLIGEDENGRAYQG